MITASNVSKSYAGKIVVDNFSLSVEKGEIFGLIGPDGAGKTTFMRVLCSLIEPDAGKIELNGQDLRTKREEIRKILGYMPQKFSLYPDLTVEQNLDFFANLFGVEKEKARQRKIELYEFSRLGNFKKRKAGKLSGGMKQKLALSCNLVHTPQLLILDEPTFGVDPISRQEFWELLFAINKAGTTILVSTPYMDEAEKCSKIALVNKGRILALGTVSTITKSYPYVLYAVYTDFPKELRSSLQQTPQVNYLQVFGNCLHVAFEKVPSPTFWQDYAKNYSKIEKIDPGLEDVFLNLDEKNDVICS